nr:hypothetical protein [Ignavibacteriaceae bacterium]
MFRKVIVVFVLVLAGSISAQEATDTLLSATVMPGDSLTVMADSVEEKSDIDSVIYASSVDSIIFFINNKKMDIYRSGYLKYKDTELKSGIINVDFGTSSIEAFGRESDTTEGKLDELPVMLDKGDEYKGN